MKSSASSLLILITAVLPIKAALTDSLTAYYNFEEAGVPGLTNMVPGAANHPGSYGAANSVGAFPDFGSGAGFAGSAAFEGAEATATTDRSTLLVGKALNVVKSDAASDAGRGWFTVNSLTGGGLAPDFTISAWFYLAPDADNGGTTAEILRDFVFEGNNNFDVSFGTGSAAGLTYTSYVGQTIHSTTPDLAAGQWHHVAHVFSQNGANTELRVYVNGSQLGSVVSTATTNMDFVGINFGANRSGTRIFDGMLDEVAVWSRALSPTEVTELRDLGLAGYPLVDAVQINLASSPSGTGSVAGSGIHARGSGVNIRATAVPGYVFSGWEGGFDGQPASFTFTANASVTSTALFSEDISDSDNDGLSNYDEIFIHLTLPGNADTDGDGIPDGAEIQIGTSPTSSDAALVDFVRNNLTPGSAGAIALSTPRITRDPLSGGITLSLSMNGSADQTTWQAIDLNAPSASIAPAADGWDVTIPAPSSSINSYILKTDAP